VKILLIEDEVKTIHALKQGLEENGFEVDIAYDGVLGLKLAKRNPYDVVVTDVILPGMNGIELCRELRNSGHDVRILMLSALGELDDKLSGFDAGADDYLPKPFEFKELLARLRVLSKRPQAVQHVGHVLRYEDLELNLDAKVASRSGRAIDLTVKEFGLLEYLLRNQGKVVSKSEIAEKIWDSNFDSSTNVIEVYINLLRKKIDKDQKIKLIHTQYGMGYILKADH
jgi:two-component system, OmpR family, copper resistance phosphate regulon response regulator CusR